MTAGAFGLQRRRLLIGVPASVLGAPLRAATPGVDAPPEPGAPRPIVIPPIRQERLPNGLTLLVVPRGGLPLVTASLYVRAGREVDPDDRAGLAILTGTLLTKGTRRGDRDIPAPQIAREAERLGGTLDASTSWRVTSLQTTVTTSRLDAALALLAECMRTPTLAAEEFERARTQALDSLRLTLANPGDVASMAARRAFWGAGPYGASMTPASLQRVTPAQVQAFHRQRYRPAQALLVLVGDVEPERGLELARAHVGSWSGDAAEQPVVPPPQSRAAPTVIVEMAGAGQSGVVVTAPFSSMAAPDRRIGEVAAALLGGGYSARLNQEIRIKRGLSYGAFGGGEAQTAGGMFVARTQTQNATAMQVAQLMRDELLRAGREEAKAAELAARQATLVGSFTRQLETTGGLADQVASQWFQGRPLEALGRYVDEVLAVTPAQVREYAQRHWRAEALRTVVAGDVPSTAADAGRRVPIASLDLEQPALTR